MAMSRLRPYSAWRHTVSAHVQESAGSRISPCIPGGPWARAGPGHVCGWAPRNEYLSWSPSRRPVTRGPAASLLP